MKCLKSECPEFPVVRKCCYCVPIRRGIIIFGYVNVVLSLLSFPLLIFLLVEEVATGKAAEEKEHLDPLVFLPVTITFVAIDVLITIVLLVGAHKKKRILLQIYFYFSVVFQALTLCLDLVYFDYREYIENTLYFIFLGLNIYLLFLVYNVIRAFEQNSDVQYVAYHSNQQV